jgi:hypothetical protein
MGYFESQNTYIRNAPLERNAITVSVTSSVYIKPPVAVLTSLELAGALTVFGSSAVRSV